MLRRPNTSDFKKTKRPVRLKRTVRTLLSPEQLNNAMARESSRVDRKGAGALSLLLFRIPLDQRNTLTAVRLAKTILKRVRVTDDVGWFDEQHLGVLLPDTLAAGAWRLAQAVCDTVAKRGPRPLCTMYTYPAQGEGDAEMPPGIVRASEAASALAPSPEHSPALTPEPDVVKVAS
jgi:hypothetical protein